MKFLKKSNKSQILELGLTYQENRAENNKHLKEMLLSEQKNFCAYTEKYINQLDSCEVEHFNSSIKYKDNYFNYYAVIRAVNLFKKDELYKNASFFKNLFFQKEDNLKIRIYYVDGIFCATNKTDKEATEFIDFLGLNHPSLYEQRRKYIDRIKQTFFDAKYSKNQYLLYFRKHKEDLHFVTATEKELEINLSEFYK